jgi:hypothetical protein
MPNWCTNRLTIAGPDDKIQELLDKARGPDQHGNEEEFTFHSFVPMPDDVFRGNLSMEDEKKHPGEKNWLGFCRENWGTKWDCTRVAIEDGEEGGKVIHFDTAWSPPTPILDKISQLFPELSIVHEFADEGWGFVGENLYENGGLASESLCTDHESEHMREVMMDLCDWEPEEDEEE